MQKFDLVKILLPPFLVIGFIFLFFFLKTFLSCYAFMEGTFTPKVSIEEQYEHNVEPDPTDYKIESFWLSMVSPGLSLHLQSPISNLDLNYEAQLPFYHKRKIQDRHTEDIRHQGKILWAQKVAPNISFNINDNFITYEDRIPSFDSNQVLEIFSEKNIYYQNNGEISLSYMYGSQDFIRLGYRNKYLNSQSSEFEDSRSHEGFFIIEKWVIPRVGTNVTCRFNNGKFKQPQEESLNGSKDFREYEGGVNLKYLWKPPFHLMYINYSMLKKDFIKEPSDKKGDNVIYKGLLGFSSTLSPYTQLSGEGGYYIQDYTGGDQLKNVLYSFRLNKSMEKTSFIIEGSGGYNEDYFSAENLGASRYMQGLSSFNHVLDENIELFGSLLYRREHFYEMDNIKESWQTEAGLSFLLFDWFTLSIKGNFLLGNHNVKGEERRDEIWQINTEGDIHKWNWLILSFQGLHSESDSTNSKYSFRDNKILLKLTSLF